MLKKLRIKFVAITMILITVVMVVFFVAIGYSDYQRDLTSATTAMEQAIEASAEHTAANNNEADHGQYSPQSNATPNGDSSEPAITSPEPGGDTPEPTGELSDPGEGISSDQNNNASTTPDISAPKIGGHGQVATDLIPLAVYTVESESLVVVPQSTTATLSDEVLSIASAKVSSLDEGVGEIPEAGLRYLKRTTGETTYIAFVDTSSTDTWKSQVGYLIIAGICMLVVFFIVVLFFSKWALKPVKDAWDAQRQFVTDASHELKTPLTVVLANTSILLKHSQDSVASQSQWIESTQIEAHSMQNLVNEMLELAQVESKATLAHDPFNLSEAVDRTVLQFESIAFERNFSFESTIEHGVVVTGDTSKLNKMVSTLIENAAKYVNPSGLVEVELRKSGSTAKLIVHNTGSVIAAEDLPHIFDRFYRTDKARTSGAGGFGLGLAIAKETAEAHGGTITAQSSVEDGTRFIATLPCS